MINQKRQTRRESLGTANLAEASRTLAQWFVKNDVPDNGRSEDVLIEQVLLRYWEEHAKFLPSAQSQMRALEKWQTFWEGKYVADITVASQKLFRAALGEGHLTPSSLDRLLSVGRAALHRAVAQEQLLRSPKIFMTETEADRTARPEMGRPIVISEMSEFIKAIKDPSLFLFVILLANTLARPGALYDLRRKQFDAGHNLLHLNPAGRRQNKKYRPIVPVTATLRPWLEIITQPDDYYLSREVGGRLRSLDSRWDKLREATGFFDITPYSFRHGMSRELRKRRVPLEEIKLFLGHKPMGSDRTTEIYAPFDPDYCTNAISAIDTIMSEVIAVAGLTNFESPSTYLDYLTEHQPAEQLSRATKWAALTRAQQNALREAIGSGKSMIELQSEFGISTSTITKYRKKFGFGDARLRGNSWLRASCVPRE